MSLWSGRPGPAPDGRAMRIFRKGLGPHALPIAMAGVKMGERLLNVGSGDPRMFAALAGKVGLTGRACAVAEDNAGAEALRAAAARAGVLVEIEVVPFSRLPFEDAAFDVAVINGTRGLLAALPPFDRASLVGELFRALRGGGRLIAIERSRRAGLFSLAGGAPLTSEYVSSGGALRAFEAAGFRPVRVLAEREGLRFVEGLKPQGT
jgi:ubiquinone/menaquinone biosynthesis C-methylase UbiE